MKKLPILIFIIWLFSISAFAQEAKLIDEFGANINCEEYVARLDSFAIILGKNPNSTGVVITYEGKYNSNLPIFGQAQNRMSKIATHYEFRKFSTNRIMYISGGFREKFTVNLWLVPKGSEFPTPTPTLDKMKFRKGKLDNYICGQDTG